jgi:hypothetical protein
MRQPEVRATGSISEWGGPPGPQPTPSSACVCIPELSTLHRNYVGEAERGKRNIGLLNVVKLAHALGVRPMNLLDLIA